MTMTKEINASVMHFLLSIVVRIMEGIQKKRRLIQNIGLIVLI